MQSGCEDTLEERYEKNSALNLEKGPQKHMECFILLLEHLALNRASVFERFKEGRESVKDDERCGRSREVNTPGLIGQRVRVRVTILRF